MSWAAKRAMACRPWSLRLLRFSLAYRYSSTQPFIIQKDRQGTAARQTIYIAEGDTLCQQTKSRISAFKTAASDPKGFLWQSALVHLLPRGYPESVSSNYLCYASWNALQAVFGCIAGVLSIQALLGAVGVGCTGSTLPIAATLNWVLKDGVGQIGGVVYAATMKNFDSKPKTTNFGGIFVMQLACLLEFSTFLFPAFFLPLASVANIGKNIACISLSATRAAIHQSFTHRENLADITAKAASQTILASMVGTGIGCLLLAAVGPQFANLSGVFIVVCGIQLYATYRSLCLVSFRVFNMPRLQLVLDAFWSEGRQLSPQDVGQLESFICPGKDSYCINPPLAKLGIGAEQLRRAVAGAKGVPFVIVPTPGDGKLNLFIFDGATDGDVIRGFVTMHRMTFELRRLNKGQKPSQQSLELAADAAQQYCDTNFHHLLQQWDAAGWEVERSYIEQDRGRLEVLCPTPNDS